MGPCRNRSAPAIRIHWPAGRDVFFKNQKAFRQFSPLSFRPIAVLLIPCCSCGLYASPFPRPGFFSPSLDASIFNLLLDILAFSRYDIHNTIRMKRIKDAEAFSGSTLYGLLYAVKAYSPSAEGLYAFLRTFPYIMPADIVKQEETIMACFLVPAAEAVVTAAASKAAEKREPSGSVQENPQRIPFSRKLKWLSHMLLGGTVLLVFEHIWHGEISPWFPFLTAMGSPAETAEMLREISSAGVLMTVLVTAVWGVMVLVTNTMEKAVLHGTETAQ